MGKICVITGASQGIGRAAAVQMAAGPMSMSSSSSRAVARGSRRRRQPWPPKARQSAWSPTTWRDLEGIPALVQGISEEFGGIDLLLNIAGYAEPKSLLDTTAANLVTTFTINVFAMLVLIREMVRFNQGRPAKVLNVASTAGITARPGWVAYAASKAAVVSLGQTLAEELAGSGIKVYTISPGRTATELRRILAPDEDPSTIMQPEQVARVIGTLMHDDELTLDGQNIIVRQQM